MKILLAEDEIDLSNAIKKTLTISGYNVDVAYDGQEAYELVKLNEYDGIIMDVMMPKYTGIEVTKMLRNAGYQVPILILTALSEVDDKVNGLEAGADDYLTKPFAIKELLARVKALTRRVGNFSNGERCGNFVIDASSSTIKAQGEASLTNKEFKLMELFIRNKGRLLSSEQILEKIWGLDAEAEINVVWVFISALRKKMQEVGADHTIKAVRGVGYRLEQNKNE